MIYGRCIFVSISIPLCHRFAKIHWMKFFGFFIFILFGQTVKTKAKSTDCLPRTWSTRRKQNTPAVADKLVAQPIENECKNGRHTDYVLHNPPSQSTQNPSKRGEQSLDRTSSFSTILHEADNCRSIIRRVRKHEACN